VITLQTSSAVVVHNVSGYLIGSQEIGGMPLPPKGELQWWYQYYFATDRGLAGYDEVRRGSRKTHGSQCTSTTLAQLRR